MNVSTHRRPWRRLALAAALGLGLGAPLASHGGAAEFQVAQTNTPTPSAPSGTPAQGGATPAKPSTSTPPSSTPPAATPPSSTPPAPPAVQGAPSPAAGAKQPAPAPAPTPEGVPLAPGGKPQQNEIEPNGSPGVPENATTENVDVPSRPVVLLNGQSSYDDAFRSIKSSLDIVKKAMDKAGIKPAGHPVTIFSEPDDKGFKYQAAVPVAAKPDKTDLGDGVTVGSSPAGKAIKFQHRGAYDDIDSTYDVITAYLDAKGLQVDRPYIEEYLTDLTTPDDPNLQVDIYVFVK